MLLDEVGGLGIQRERVIFFALLPVLVGQDQIEPVVGRAGGDPDGGLIVVGIARGPELEDVCSACILKHALGDGVLSTDAPGCAATAGILLESAAIIAVRQHVVGMVDQLVEVPGVLRGTVHLHVGDHDVTLTPGDLASEPAFQTVAVVEGRVESIEGLAGERAGRRLGGQRGYRCKHGRHYQRGQAWVGHGRSVICGLGSEKRA